MVFSVSKAMKRRGWRRAQKVLSIDALDSVLRRGKRGSCPVMIIGHLIVSRRLPNDLGPVLLLYPQVLSLSLRLCWKEQGQVDHLVPPGVGQGVM